MLLLSSLIFVLVCFAIANLLAHGIVALSGGRISFDTARWWVGTTTRAIGMIFCLFGFAILWKIGYLGMLFGAFGKIFSLIGDLLTQFPDLLQWLVS